MGCGASRSASSNLPFHPPAAAPPAEATPHSAGTLAAAPEQQQQPADVPPKSSTADHVPTEPPTAAVITGPPVIAAPAQAQAQPAVPTASTPAADDASSPADQSTPAAICVASPPEPPPVVPPAPDKMTAVTMAAEVTPVTLGEVTPKVAYRKRHALVIGINYRGQGNLALNGCDSDALSMGWLLERIYGWNMDEVTMMTDTPGACTVNPTRSNILSAIKALVAAAKAGDTFVFYYAGHGTNIKQPEGCEFYDFEPTGMDQAIVPVDWITAGVITDNVLHTELIGALPEGCRLISIFDCCHSGTMMDLQFNFTCEPALKAGVAQEEVNPLYDYSQWQSAFKALDPVPVRQVKADVMMLSGCYDLQTSSESQGTLAGYKLSGGAFTRAFRDALGVNSFDLACKYALKETNCRMAAAGFSQRAQFSCSRPELFEGLFSFNDEAPKAPYNLPTEVASITEQVEAVAAAQAAQEQTSRAFDPSALNYLVEVPDPLPAPGTYARAKYVNDRDPFSAAARSGSHMPPHRALASMLSGAFGQNLWFSHWSTGSNSNDLAASSMVLNSGAITTATSRPAAGMATPATSADRVKSVVAYYDNYQIRGLKLGYAGDKWVTIADVSTPGLTTTQYTFDDDEVLTQLDWITADVGRMRAADYAALGQAAPDSMASAAGSYSSKTQALARNSYVLGPFGMAPWGSASNFAVPSANWIWCTAGANNSTGTEATPTFYINFLNDTGVGQAATLHVLIDDWAEAYLNGVYVGTPAGAYNFQSPTYPKIALALQPGYNNIALYCLNGGGAAGLCAAVVRNNDGKVLAKTDASWQFSLANKPDALKAAEEYGWWSYACVLGQYGSALPSNTCGDGFAVPSAWWLWCTPNAAVDAPSHPNVTPTFFNGVVNDSGQDMQAVLHLIVDDVAEVFLNGVNLATVWGGWRPGEPYPRVNMTLKPGVNVLSLFCTNLAGRAGVIAGLLDANGKLLIETDASWRCVVGERLGANSMVYNHYMQYANALGNYGMGPWGGPTNFPAQASAKWIWCTPNAAYDAPSTYTGSGVHTTFTSYYNSTGAAMACTFHILADDQAEVFVNGKSVATVTGAWWYGGAPQVAVTLQPGMNVISMLCTNWGGPAGLVAALIRNSDGAVVLTTDATWRVILADRDTSQAELARLFDRWSPTNDGWCQDVCVLGNYNMAPWSISSSFPAKAASWIWSEAGAATNARADVSPTFFNSYYNSTGQPLPATLHIVADDVADIYLNERFVRTVAAGWPNGVQVALTLLPGQNVINISCQNNGGPAGLLAALVRASDGKVLLTTDSSWHFTVSNRASTLAVVSRMCARLAHGDEAFYDGAQVLGNYGCGPWGNTSQFKIPQAKWIWSSPGATTSAPTNVKPTFFKAYNNTTGQDILATVHVLVDDIGDLYLNGSFVTAFYSGYDRASYSRIPVTLTPGVNVVSFTCTNGGGPAGLCAALVKSADQAVLLQTDETWRFTTGGQGNIGALQQGIARIQGYKYNHGDVRPYDIFIQTTKQPNGKRLCGDRAVRNASGTVVRNGPLPSSGRTLGSMRIQCYLGNGAFLMGMQACTRSLSSSSPDEILALRAVTSEWFVSRFLPTASWVLAEDMQDDGTRVKSYHLKIQSKGCSSCVYSVKPDSLPERIYVNGKPFSSFPVDASGTATVPGKNGLTDLSITYQTLPGTTTNPLDALMQVPTITVSYLSATVSETATVTGVRATCNVTRSFTAGVAPADTLAELSPCVSFKLNPAVAIIDSLSTATKADVASKLSNMFGQEYASDKNDVASMIVNMAQAMTRKENYLYGIIRMDPLPGVAAPSITIGIVNTPPTASATASNSTATRELPTDATSDAASAAPAAGQQGAVQQGVTLPPNFVGTAMVGSAALQRDLLAYILLRNSGHADLLSMNRLAIESAARSFWDWVSDQVGDAVDAVSGVVNSAIGAISAVVNYIQQGATVLATNIASGAVLVGDLVACNIVNGFNFVLDKSTDLGKTVLTKLAQGIDPANWGEAAQTVFRNVAKDITNVAHAVAELGAMAGSAVQSFFTGAVYGIYDHVIQPLSDGFVVVFKVLKDGLVKMVSFVMSTVDDLFGYLKGIWDRFKDGVITFINYLTFLFSLGDFKVAKDNLKAFYTETKTFVLGFMDVTIGSLLGSTVNSAIDDTKNGHLASALFGSSMPSSSSNDTFIRDTLASAQVPMAAASWLLDKVMSVLSELNFVDVESLIKDVPLPDGCSDVASDVASAFAGLVSAVDLPGFVNDMVNGWRSALMSCVTSPTQLPDVLKSLVYDLVNRLGVPVGVILDAIRRINLKNLFAWVFRFIEIDVINLAGNFMDTILGPVLHGLGTLFKNFWGSLIGSVTIIDMFCWAFAIPMTLGLKVTGLWSDFSGMGTNYWRQQYWQFSTKGQTAYALPSQALPNATATTYTATRDAMVAVPPIPTHQDGDAAGSSAAVASTAVPRQAGIAPAGVKERALAYSDWMGEGTAGKVAGWIGFYSDAVMALFYPRSVSLVVNGEDGAGWFSIGLLAISTVVNAASGVIWVVKTDGAPSKIDMSFKLYGNAMRAVMLYTMWGMGPSQREGPQATVIKRLGCLVEGTLIIVGSTVAFAVGFNDSATRMPELQFVAQICDATRHLLLTVVDKSNMKYITPTGVGVIIAKAYTNLFRADVMRF